LQERELNCVKQERNALVGLQVYTGGKKQKEGTGESVSDKGFRRIYFDFLKLFLNPFF